MAQGWDSYFHNLQPLSSNPRGLTGSSESEGSLSQHIDNFIGHHDFSNMVASEEAPATNSNFNTNFYSNSSVSSSDCVYQRYYDEMPWQADGEQMAKDHLPRCENSNTPDFSAEGLSTSGHFPSSFATDLQELKQDCGILASPFEDYSDVSSCSEADVNETRPSCKFMKSNSGPKPKIDVTKKQGPSEWPFTPTGNMSIPMENMCPDVSETTLVALPGLSKGEAGGKMLDGAQDKIKTVEKLVKPCIQNDQSSGTSTMATTKQSKSIEDRNEHDGCEEQQQRVDVEEKRAIIQRKDFDTSIGSHENVTGDALEEAPDGDGQEQICTKQNKDQETTVVAQNRMATLDGVGEDDLDVKGQEEESKETRKNQENKEGFDKQKSPTLISKDSQDKNMRKDDQDKETQPSTFESLDSQGIKASVYQDATHKLKEHTLAAPHPVLKSAEEDSHLESSNQYVESCLQFHEHQSKSTSQDNESSGPVDGSADSVDTSKMNPQTNNSNTGIDPCIEKEWKSPAEKTNASDFPDQEQSSQQSQMTIEPPGISGDDPENTTDSFQELHTTPEEELSEHGMMYGEPLSREDSLCEADETQFEEGSVAMHDNESANHLELQAAQLKCSVQLRKRLQPVVVLKTAEPRNATNKGYHCADCQLTTQNIDNLIEHHHCSHSRHEFQLCLTCNVYMMSNEQAEKHLCSVTDEAPQLSPDSTLKQKRIRRRHYKCKKCRLTFAKFYIYVTHMRSHTGKTPYKCNGCGSYFAQTSTLYRHKRVPGRCQRQNLTVAAKDSDATLNKTKTTMQKDLIRNTSYPTLPECYVKLVDVCKTNACYLCGKSFMTTQQLKKHGYNVHKRKIEIAALSEDIKSVSVNKTVKEGTEPRGKHKCPLCPRVFKYSYNRARHLRDCIKDFIYGGRGKIGKKYQCPLCLAAFTLSANRRRHVNNTCLREYTRQLVRIKTDPKDSQKRAQPQIVTGHGHRYKCSLCPAVFCHPSGKYKHMKKHELFKVTGKLFNYRNASFSKQAKSISKNTEEDTLTSDETRSRPSFACHFCGKCFNKSVSLRNHEHSHKGERPYHCLECGKAFKKQETLMVHKMVHQKRIQCTVCKEMLPTIGELIQHRKSHLEKGILQCPDCPMQFQYPVYLLRHLVSHKCGKEKTPEAKVKPPKPQLSLQSLKEQESQKPPQCSLCNEVFHDGQALRKHCLKHIAGSSSRQCPFCRRHFTNRRYLLRHMHRHTGSKPFPCICGKQFYREMYLKLHQEKCPKCPATEPKHDVISTTDKKSFKCSYCPRIFTRRNRFRKHLNGHKLNTLLACSKCGQCFGCTKIRQHHRDCSGTSDLNTGLSSPGGHCSKSIAQKSDQKVHEKALQSNATGKMLQHKCPHCPQRFKYRSFLLRHLVKHTGEQPYACMHCDQKYGSRSMCLQHEAFCDGVSREGQSKVKDTVKTKFLHASSPREAKEKPQAEGDGEYKCKFCTKTFIKSRNLRHHILTHTEVKPYRCKACDSCFSRYDYLKVHQARCKGKRLRLEVRIPKISLDDVGKGWQNKFDRLTNRKKTYECSLCSREFPTQSKLSRHFSVLHVPKSCSCSRCGTSFTHVKSLKRHKRFNNCRRVSRKTNDALQVSVNPQTENETEPLSGVTNRILQRARPYFEKKHKHVCKYCPRSFGTNWQLRVHTRLHTGEKPYGCDHCGERFIRRDYLLRHSAKCNQSEEQMGPVLCDWCGAFYSRDKLENHKKICSSTPSLPDLRDYLLRHSAKCNQSEEQMDPVLCDWCGAFYSRDKLENHKKMCSSTPSLPDLSQQSTSRSPPKGFSCAYCSSRFLMFSQLQEHFLNAHRQDTILEPPVSTAPLQQHLSNIVSIKEEPLDEREVDKQLSGDGNLLFDQDNSFNDQRNKPFPCPYCDMFFINKSGLSGHVRIHSKDYPFTCKRCKKGFWNKNLLRNHTRKCRRRNVAKRNSNLESVTPATTEMDLALNDNVLVFKEGSKTTGTGVLQTNFSCKEELKDIPQNSAGNREQSSSSRSKKTVQYQCSECDKSFTDGLMLISHLEDHGRLEQEKKRNTCSQCGRVCASPGNLEKHMKIHDIHSCPTCFKTFTSLTELNIHRVCHDPSRPFACKVCDQRFWTRPSLCNHYSEAHPNHVYACRFCDKSYSIKKSLVRHYRMRHQDKDIGGSIDGNINEKSNTEQQSSIHVNTTGESDKDSKDENDGSGSEDSDSDNDSDSAPYFPCHVCGKTFLTSESLEDHQRCHLGEKPHECAECGKCFFQASQLQQHQRMHNSEYQCQICGRGFVSFFALRKHKHSHGKSRPYRCSKCHLSFTGPSQLAEHMATHREDNFPCDICNRTFSTKSSRAEHRKRHGDSGGSVPPLISPEQQRISPSPECSSTVTKELKYRCGICNECFKDPEELSEHGCTAAKERQYSCPDCNKHFLHGSHLRKHRATHHPSQPSVYHCNKCNRSFSSRQLFLSHLERHGDDTPAAIKGGALGEDAFKCPICHVHFTTAIELISHFSVHTEDAYECKVCKLTFVSKSKLEEHKRCHLTAATQFECTECRQSFLGSDAFRQHRCSHQQNTVVKSEYSNPSTKESPVSYNQAMGEEEDVDVTGEDFYNCPVCSKPFSSKSGLLEHQNKHCQNEKPFKCELCGKTFTLRKYLKEHEKRHRYKMAIQNAKLSENQFKCPHCPVTVGTAQDLSLHMRMHAEQDVGVHRCDMCYRSFSGLMFLRQHQESHVGQVVYECTECDKAFAFPHLLEEHQQTHAGPSL